MWNFRVGRLEDPTKSGYELSPPKWKRRAPRKSSRPLLSPNRAPDAESPPSGARHAPDRVRPPYGRPKARDGAVPASLAVSVDSALLARKAALNLVLRRPVICWLRRNPPRQI